MNRKSELRKATEAFWICVEGECEKLYFDRLEKLINESNLKVSVKFFTTIEKNPEQYIKSYKPEGRIFFVWDREGNTDEYMKNFQKTLQTLSTLASHYDIKPGYSHFTFELWILLHLGEMYAPQNKKEDYLKYINQWTGKKFESLKEYKSQKNFKSILESLELEHVKNAIERGEKIRNSKGENEFRCIGKYKVCDQNPDLMIHECILSIFKICGVVSDSKTRSKGS